MSEKPRHREGILRFNISEESRAEAAAYLDSNPEMLERVLSSESALSAREVVLSHFGITAELEPDPRPRLTELQKAVLVEAIDRWNQKRILEPNQ